MWTSTPPPGGDPEPAPHDFPISAGRGDDDDHDDFSPLLDLLQRFPDLFLKELLERLFPTARGSLARTGIAFWDMVFPRSIFPYGLLHTETPASGAGAARVFKLVDFLGTFERLAWAKANGCPWTAQTCSLAALGGHLVALRWARANGCPWDELTPFNAADGGHLDVLRWAREHDCPWDDGTCWSAAEGGHLEVLQWARAHGCPWSKSMCAATSREHPETLAWVRQQPE
jgi:hypothetical protein